MIVHIPLRLRAMVAVEGVRMRPLVNVRRHRLLCHPGWQHDMIGIFSDFFSCSVCVVPSMEKCRASSRIFQSSRATLIIHANGHDRKGAVAVAHRNLSDCVLVWAPSANEYRGAISSPLPDTHIGLNFEHLWGSCFFLFLHLFDESPARYYKAIYSKHKERPSINAVAPLLSVFGEPNGHSEVYWSSQKKQH